MKRFRLSTLLLLVVIAALSVALLEQRRRSARREAWLAARLAAANEIVAERYQLGIFDMSEGVTMRRRERSDTERGGR